MFWSLVLQWSKNKMTPILYCFAMVTKSNTCYSSMTFTYTKMLIEQNTLKDSNYCFNSFLAIRLWSKDLKHLIPGNGVPDYRASINLLLRCCSIIFFSEFVEYFSQHKRALPDEPDLRACSKWDDRSTPLSSTCTWWPWARWAGRGNVSCGSVTPPCPGSSWRKTGTESSWNRPAGPIQRKWMQL